MCVFNQNMLKYVCFLFLFSIFSCKNKIEPEIECVGINYTANGEKIDIEVLLRNNSDRTLGIPYRFFEEYEEADNKTLVIKTFTEKELKGDFSVTADEKIVCDNLEATNSYILLSDVKPGDIIVLFFSFDLNSCEHLHKESIKNIAEYDKIYIEFLYVDFAASFDIDKIYVRTMPVKHTTDLALPNFDVFSYIDNWEKSMMFVGRNTKVIYEHSP